MSSRIPALSIDPFPRYRDIERRLPGSTARHPSKRALRPRGRDVMLAGNEPWPFALSAASFGMASVNLLVLLALGLAGNLVIAGTFTLIAVATD